MGISECKLAYTPWWVSYMFLATSSATVGVNGPCETAEQQQLRLGDLDADISDLRRELAELRDMARVGSTSVTVRAFCR